MVLAEAFGDEGGFLFQFVVVVHDLPRGGGEITEVAGVGPAPRAFYYFGGDTFAVGGFLFGDLGFYDFARESAPDEGFFAGGEGGEGLAAGD